MSDTARPGTTGPSGRAVPPETIGGTGIDVHAATVSALGAALAAGTLTSAALTAFYLSRIERLDPLLHAVLSVNPAALAEAEAADAARAAGRRPGPLAGIPVLIKDNIGVLGQPATVGSPALAAAEQGDAFLVTRLRAAGAVVLGKANLSEWANFRSSHSTSGWSTLGGQTANPHALDRNPSGSSSGSAVAVAAGLAPLAVGTETDGSIVSPASACGIVGIKPTVGLISRSGVVPVSLAQDTAGPMACSVADAAVLLSALAGPDPADPATEGAAGQPPDYAAFLDPGALAGARLGVWRDPVAAASPAIAAVLDTAVTLLREAGADVTDPVEVPGTHRVSEPEWAALKHEFKLCLNAYLRGLGGDHPADLAAVIEFNRARAATVLARFGQDVFEHAEATSGDPADPGYLAARAEASRLAAEALGRPLAEHRLDAVITLTATPAWLTDYLLGDHGVFHTSGLAAVSGYPSVTVPAGGVAGLPVGLSFTGPAWSEPRLIALAHAFGQYAPARLVPALRASHDGPPVSPAVSPDGSPAVTPAAASASGTPR
ncbi:MAG TPA: amidase [Streptosporangiaceae bacterium]|nr:amidase [Streptosporangiaceae bacterium]